LLSAIARIGPREIILSQGRQAAGVSAIASMLERERHAISYHPTRTIESAVQAWLPFLENAEAVSDAAEFSVEEVAAGTCLLDYIEVQLQGLKTKLQAPIRRHTAETMSIDKNSMRALEVKTTLRDGAFKGSLLHAMRKTVTNSGSRLLSDWISKMPRLTIRKGRC
jgi:DNA mismatch repair ATPase MutS